MDTTDTLVWTPDNLCVRIWFAERAISLEHHAGSHHLDTPLHQPFVLVQQFDDSATLADAIWDIYTATETQDLTTTIGPGHFTNQTLPRCQGMLLPDIWTLVGWVQQARRTNPHATPGTYSSVADNTLATTVINNLVNRN